MSRETESGEIAVARTNRFSGILVGLLLASGAFALPLRAEEITVTIPPDPPAAEAPKSAAPLPSFAAGDNLSQAADDSAGAAPANTETAPAAAPTSTKVVKHKKEKKPAAAEAVPAADAPAAGDVAAAPAASASTSAGAAATDGSAKPADKTKQAAAKPSPCKGLDEPTCGGNKLCSWVLPTPDASGKAGAAKCRSLAVLKKEAAKAAAAAKGEVLPWATNATSATGASATTTSSTTPAGDAPAKPAAVKKTKTAAVKKTPKPAVVAPPVPMATDGAQPPSDGSTQEAPSSAAPPPAPDAQ